MAEAKVLTQEEFERVEGKLRRQWNGEGRYSHEDAQEIMGYARELLASHRALLERVEKLERENAQLRDDYVFTGRALEGRDGE